MFQEGQRVGIYTLIKKLARGGFGEVWLAEKQSEFVTKKFAVKLPLDEQIDLDAIRREATLWEQASGHPNVLPIIDADIYDGQVAIVSEYAEDGSLADKLNLEGKFPVVQAVEMIIGILNGLDYLHSKNIIHRDIKPQNILLQGNTPRLADFGISRVIQTSTISSVLVGTESYMSPESFEGIRSIPGDIWAVGVVLYKLLSGNLPFPQKEPTEIMYAVLLKEPEPLPDYIPLKLQEIVYKALEKDHSLASGALPRRYQTAAAMREDLTEFLKTYSESPGLPQTVSYSPIQPAPDVATKVQLRIPVPQPGSAGVFFKKGVLPVILLAGLLGVIGISWLFFRAAGQTPVGNSNVSNSAPSNINSDFKVNANEKAGSNSNASVSNLTVQDYFNQAAKFYKQKKYDRAIEAYTKAIELNPSDYTIYNNRGLIFYTRKNYEQAIADFDKSIELNPASLTYNNRGVAYEDMGNTEQAIADYRKAVELDSKNEKANRNLNRILK